MHRMFLSVIFINTCSFCLKPFISRQVSEPYRSTAFTFDPKIVNLVLVVSAEDRHIGLNIVNAFLAFPMLFWISLSPFFVIILPTYVNLSTSSTCYPSIDTSSPPLVQIRINFVYETLIFRSTFAPGSVKACVLSFMFCILCDSRVRSSAKLRSSKFVKDHWIPRLLANVVLVNERQPETASELAGSVV